MLLTLVNDFSANVRGKSSFKQLSANVRVKSSPKVSNSFPQTLVKSHQLKLVTKQMLVEINPPNHSNDL